MTSGVPARDDVVASRDAELQCAVRDANELVERANVTRPAGATRRAMRCECGDPRCRARVAPTHDEYEAVRASGSHFLIDVNHENPESAWVLRESSAFAVIDVVAGDARHAVLARNPRHAWVEPAVAGEGGT
jgi:hypothetical protein